MGCEANEWVSESGGEVEWLQPIKGSNSCWQVGPSNANGKQLIFHLPSLFCNLSDGPVALADYPVAPCLCLMGAPDACTDKGGWVSYGCMLHWLYTSGCMHAPMGRSGCIPFPLHNHLGLYTCNFLQEILWHTTFHMEIYIFQHVSMEAGWTYIGHILSTL